MNKLTIKPIALVAGTTLAAMMGAAPAQADVNPFGMSALASGYMVASAKGSETKCGSNKSVSEAECGANKATTKVAEAECGSNKQATEAKCGADQKVVAKPVQEAKCGEAKCGSNKK